MKYSVIPDIHADFKRLKSSLKACAKSQKLIFLGDLIDAGDHVENPADLSVLQSVRALCENHEALCVMGNHELNAILYHRKTQKKCQSPLREHSSNNLKQHKSFINEFGTFTEPALYWTNWFLETMPLWLEFDGLRIVHACWSMEAIDIVKKRRPNGYLKLDDLEEIAAKQSIFAKAVELIVSGPEYKLPDGFSFHDKNGKKRKNVRLAWWNTNADTWQNATLSVPDKSELPDTLLPSDALTEIYCTDAPPVLVGHYKMTGTPAVQNKKATSLDFPEKPCVYHWSGEAELTEINLQIIHDS